MSRSPGINAVKLKNSKKQMVNYFGRGYLQTTGACTLKQISVPEGWTLSS